MSVSPRDAANFDIGMFHNCDLCLTVKVVSNHSKLVGAGDIAHPGFEVEPPTPDDACRLIVLYDISHLPDLIESLANLNK